MPCTSPSHPIFPGVKYALLSPHELRAGRKHSRDLRRPEPWQWEGLAGQAGTDDCTLEHMVDGGKLKVVG